VRIPKEKNPSHGTPILAFSIDLNLVDVAFSSFSRHPSAAMLLEHLRTNSLLDSSILMRIKFATHRKSAATALQGFSRQE
jgi:hypothetical protein